MLILASLVVGFFVAEVGIRAFQFVRDGTAPLAWMPGYRESTFLRSPFLPFGPRVNWNFVRAGDPAWTRFNSLGLRMPDELPEREPGEVRVLALGGSTTENVWNDLGIHWALVFECMARREGRRDVRVLNAGMSAYSTAHSLVRYQLDLAETKPDIVLVMHNINDLTVSYHSALAGQKIDPNYLVKYGTRGYTGQVDESDIVISRLVNMVRSRVFGPASSRRVFPDSASYDLPEAERIFRRNLVLLIQAIKSSGATPVLLTMPRSDDPRWVELARRGDMAVAGLGLLPEASIFFPDFDRFNDVIRAVAADHGALSVDMAQNLAEEAGTFVDVVHYSTQGVRAFGRELYGAADRFLPPATTAVLERAVVPCAGVL
jgi:hypothetical protein